MSLFNRNLQFIKRVVYNPNVNREKFCKNKQNYQMYNKKKIHTFSGGGGPQGNGPNLLYMGILGAVAYYIVKKR
jgi:hypothetical protein